MIAWDKFWTIAEQVPGLAVLVFLVYFFLKHIRTESKTIREHNRSLNEKATEVIENNTQALMGHNEVIQDLREQISNQTTITQLSEKVIAELKRARDDGAADS